MENFPSNSREPRKSEPIKREEKVVLRVVEGDVVRRKKSLTTRFREMFLGDDTKGVFEYVLGDVLVPALKDMITDSVSQGMERLIFGNARPNNRRGGSRPGAFGNNSGPVNYNRYAGSNRESSQSGTMSRRARASHDFDDIILATRGEAEQVIDQLTSILEKYEIVSVRDLYETVGVEFHHTDEKWGWTNLREARVTRVSNGYLLDLPKTEPID